MIPVKAVADELVAINIAIAEAKSRLENTGDQVDPDLVAERKQIVSALNSAKKSAEKKMLMSERSKFYDKSTAHPQVRKRDRTRLTISEPSAGYLKYCC